MAYVGVGEERAGDFNVDDQSDSHITLELAEGSVWVQVGLLVDVQHACESRSTLYL